LLTSDDKMKHFVSLMYTHEIQKLYIMKLVKQTPTRNQLNMQLLQSE